MSNKFLLLRLPANVDDVLERAAHKRRMHKVHLIERLLTVAVSDKLIDAVLDDVDTGGSWHKNTRRNWPT